jgi:hypothetical protein
MATGSAYADDDPHRMLSQARELTQRVRAAQRATWFPLLVFAAVTFAAIPVYHYGRYSATCRPLDGAVGAVGAVGAGKVCVVYSTSGFVYWPIAFVLAYVAITACYVRRARARGVGTRIRPYVIAGIIIAAVVTGASLWAAAHPPVGDYGILGLHVPARSPGWFYRLASPAGAIGLALLVLARIERSRALVVFALCYLAIVLVPINFGWVMTGSSWHLLPRLVIDGAVLLLGGTGFAVAQRPARGAAVDPGARGMTGHPAA